MSKDVILGILRHILTTLGGSLVANGTLTDSGLAEGVGAAMTIIGIGWSIANKKK